MLINLNNFGDAAEIDDDDYEKISHLVWDVSFHNKYEIKYAVAKVPREVFGVSQISMHRLITGAEEGMVVDHKDNNGLNNKKNNLRICTTQQNNRNSRKSKNCSSRYKGVSWKNREKRWCAQIMVDCKNIGLGYFKDENDAARSYNEAAVRLFGEFAKLNDIVEVNWENWP